jgi:hypothetical protein
MDQKDKELRLAIAAWPESIPRLGRREALSSSLRETLSLITPLIATAGILIYALLSVAYEQFYSPISVDPSDVGFNYANILAHSVGFVVSVVIIPLAIAAYVIIFMRWLGPMLIPWMMKSKSFAEFASSLMKSPNKDSRQMALAVLHDRRMVRRSARSRPISSLTKFIIPLMRLYATKRGLRPRSLTVR